MWLSEALFESPKESHVGTIRRRKLTQHGTTCNIGMGQRIIRDGHGDRAFVGEAGSAGASKAVSLLKLCGVPNARANSVFRCIVAIQGSKGLGK